MTHEWRYFTLRPDGVLVDERLIPLADAQTRADGSTRVFADAAEAEAWLIANDIRGNVREASPLPDGVTVLDLNKPIDLHATLKNVLGE